jgi:hypothetical protein
LEFDPSAAVLAERVSNPTGYRRSYLHSLEAVAGAVDREFVTLTVWDGGE